MPRKPEHGETVSRDAENPAEAAGLAAVEDQAEGFRLMREARASQVVEDYIELIADLIDDAAEARPVDIAARLGVTNPTVNNMLKRLKDEGLISQRPYRSVFLTDKGRALAEASRKRHQIVERFLLSLGISPATARNDAEGMEHYASEETLAAFMKFTRENDR